MQLDQGVIFIPSPGKTLSSKSGCSISTLPKKSHIPNLEEYQIKDPLGTYNSFSIDYQARHKRAASFAKQSSREPVTFLGSVAKEWTKLDKDRLEQRIRRLENYC